MSVTVETAINMLFQSIENKTNIMLKELEKHTSPFMSVGYGGVESAKEHAELNRCIKLFKEIKKTTEKYFEGK